MCVQSFVLNLSRLNSKVIDEQSKAVLTLFEWERNGSEFASYILDTVSYENVNYCEMKQ